MDVLTFDLLCAGLAVVVGVCGFVRTYVKYEAACKKLSRLESVADDVISKQVAESRKRPER